MSPRLPIARHGLEPGLVCRYYEGEWRKLPDFASITPQRTGTVRSVTLPEFARRDHFALELEGFLRAPEDGLYTLSLRSDDGSALFLGDDEIIDADGLHGEEDRRVEVALKAGLHPIRVVYFQAAGDSALSLWIEGPRTVLQRVAAESLFH